jgi:hypothetical protein
MSESVTVGQVPVRDNWAVRCQVSYYKGRGYFFSATPVEDLGDGLISIRLSMLGLRPELLQEAKRFSRKTFDQLVAQMRDACNAGAPIVERHVADATGRVPKEVQHVGP